MILPSSPSSCSCCHPSNLPSFSLLFILSLSIHCYPHPSSLSLFSSPFNFFSLLSILDLIPLLVSILLSSYFPPLLLPSFSLPIFTVFLLIYLTFPLSIHPCHLPSLLLSSLASSIYLSIYLRLFSPYLPISPPFYLFFPCIPSSICL